MNLDSLPVSVFRPQLREVSFHNDHAVEEAFFLFWRFLSSVALDDHFLFEVLLFSLAQWDLR